MWRRNDAIYRNANCDQDQTDNLFAGDCRVEAEPSTAIDAKCRTPVNITRERQREKASEQPKEGGEGTCAHKRDLGPKCNPRWEAGEKTPSMERRMS